MSEITAPRNDWRALVDPTAGEVLGATPVDVLASDAAILGSPAPSGAARSRPRVECRPGYVLAQMVVPVVLRDDDRVYYQEVDAVLAPGSVLVVSKTPADGEAFAIDELQLSCASAHSTGEVTVRLFELVADRFLQVMEDLLDEVEEAEDNVDMMVDGRRRRGPHAEGTGATDPATRIRDLRRDLIEVRRTLMPTREALQGIVSDRIELADTELFGPEIEARLRDVDSKLLRAADTLDTARDLVAGLKDHFVSIESHRQNQVVNRLTVVASLLLLPTLVAGVFGQNFDDIPAQHWAGGFWMSVMGIVVLSSAQLLLFHHLGWIDLAPRSRREPPAVTGPASEERLSRG